MAQNILNHGKDIEIQTHEAQKCPNRINSKKSTQIHIIIKSLRVKEKKEFWKQQEQSNLPHTKEPP